MLYFQNNIVILDTTESTNISSGAFIVAGGCSISKSLYTSNINFNTSTGGTIRLTGDLIFSGSARSIGSVTNHGLNLITNNSNRLSIVPGGNVGIGMTSPKAPLQIGTTDGDKIVFAEFQNTAGSKISHSVNWSVDHYAGRGLEDAGRFRFFTSSTTGYVERMVINSGGNIGIATTAPSQRLEVSGGVKLIGTPTVTNDQAAAYIWNQGGIGPTIAGYRFQVRTGGDTPRITVLENGNVGIATTAPSTRLQVVGDFQNSRVYTDGGGFFPTADNTYLLGFSGSRWSQVWAVNGTIQTSDIRLKEHKELEYGLDEIMRVRTIKYRWRDDEREHVDSAFEYYGFDAQNLLTIFPELVYDETEPYGVNYTELLPVIVNAIKQLNTKLNILL